MTHVPTTRPPTQGKRILGFYLHACWDFAYPYAVRTWGPDDYRAMFRLLRRLDIDTVMLWPVVEAIPAPLSAADRADLAAFRRTISDAQEAGLACWLTQCAALGCAPELAAKPWLQRNFYPARRTLRLDREDQRIPYLAHRRAILCELNNADAYVTIDGDPGGYPGALAEDFVAVLASDRETIRAHGTDPTHQAVVSWLWAGWGQPFQDAQVWDGDPGPWLASTAVAIAEAQAVLDPSLVLPGRHADATINNRRRTLEAVSAAGLQDRSVTFLYQAIEFEPIPPAVEPAFDRIRAMMHEEKAAIAAGRGVFGNAQQPLLQLPNLWFFARSARDPAYLGRSDAAVFADLAAFLGGDPALLTQAWCSLSASLAELPADLPARLRSCQLGQAAEDLPGGAERYLELLARQVECRRGCLLATAEAPTDSAEAVDRCLVGCRAIFAWWSDNRYVFDAADGHDFHWRHVHPALRRDLEHWTWRHRALLARQRDALISGFPDAERAVARVDELLGAP